MMCDRYYGSMGEFRVSDCKLVLDQGFNELSKGRVFKLFIFTYLKRTGRWKLGGSQRFEKECCFSFWPDDDNISLGG